MTPEIEKQLTDLELRHKRHQWMLEDHREAKFIRRENHRKGIHKIKPCPILLR
jgi:hypothetical protein